jgi:hypothetical protein
MVKSHDLITAKKYLPSPENPKRLRVLLGFLFNVWLGSFSEVKRPDREVTNPRSVPWLRMSEAIQLLPMYAFMA